MPKKKGCFPPGFLSLHIDHHHHQKSVFWGTLPKIEGSPHLLINKAHVGKEMVVGHETGWGWLAVFCDPFNSLRQCHVIFSLSLSAKASIVCNNAMIFTVAKVTVVLDIFPGWWLKVSSMPVYNQECLVNPNPQSLLFPSFFRWRSSTMPCNFLYTDVEQTANSLPFPSPSGINSPSSEFANTSGSWWWSRSQPTRNVAEYCDSLMLSAADPSSSWDRTDRSHRRVAQTNLFFWR